MMTFAGHDAGPRGTAIENDFFSTLSVLRSRLVGSDPRAWHRNWTDYGVSGTIAFVVPHRLSRICRGSHGKW
jgi:hypothetical protein